MVPTGTFRTIPSPSRPVFFDPSPCRPRPAVYSGLKRKCTSVLWRSLDSIQMSPPLPPSPPDGPPRGMNFSRRNAMQPLPPSPAFTRILASSINIEHRHLANVATAAITVTCDQPYLEGDPPSLRFVRFCASIRVGVLYGPQRNRSNCSRAMRSATTATRFDHGSQVNGFHARRKNAYQKGKSRIAELRSELHRIANPT